MATFIRRDQPVIQARRDGLTWTWMEGDKIMYASDEEFKRVWWPANNAAKLEYFAPLGPRDERKE